MKLFTIECQYNNDEAIVRAEAKDGANGDLQNKTIEGYIALNDYNPATMGQVEICGADLAKLGIKACGASDGGGAG